MWRRHLWPHQLWTQTGGCDWNTPECWRHALEHTAPQLLALHTSQQSLLGLKHSAPDRATLLDVLRFLTVKWVVSSVPDGILWSFDDVIRFLQSFWPMGDHMWDPQFCSPSRTASAVRGWFGRTAVLGRKFAIHTGYLHCAYCRRHDLNNLRKTVRSPTSVIADSLTERGYGPLGCLHSPHDTPDNVERLPANHAHGSVTCCKGHLANYRGQGRGKRKDTEFFLSLHVAFVWWRPYPTNLTPPSHHCLSPTPTCKKHPLFVCPKKLRYLGLRPPLQPQLWETGPCCGHTTSQGRPALPGLTTAVAPRGVPASTNEVFPAPTTYEALIHWKV